MGVKPGAKKSILLHLAEQKGTPVSGAALARLCNVSRTAVWKAVQNLKKEGYAISAVQNRGYTLEGENNKISETDFKSALSGSAADTARLIILKTVDSTNTYIKQFAAQPNGHGTVVIAETQTAGRGRLGRSFFSPEGSGLYMSVLYRPAEHDAELRSFDPAKYTVAAAVAVCRALEQLTNKKAQIKWVNDVFLDGKKTCGILTDGITNLESRTFEYVIIGIGVNISTSDFPDEIRQTATSVFVNETEQKSQENFSRSFLAARITSHLFELLQKNDYSALMNEYRSLSCILGMKVRVEQGNDIFEATAEQIDDNGRLIVRTTDGQQHTLISGEVRIRV